MKIVDIHCSLIPRKWVSTFVTKELAARKAIKILEGKDSCHVAECLDNQSLKYWKMVETITQGRCANSLMYQRLEDMESAIGLPIEGICAHCWNGRP
jgi:amidophosphoribosyltransferase